jgi:hypothetical protein
VTNNPAQTGTTQSKKEPEIAKEFVVDLSLKPSCYYHHPRSSPTPPRLPSPLPRLAMMQPTTKMQQPLLAALTATLTIHNNQPAPTINAQVTVSAHITQDNQRKDTIQKPQTFNGLHDQTQSFLAGFQIWAAAQEKAMTAHNEADWVQEDHLDHHSPLLYERGCSTLDYQLSGQLQ